MKLLHVDNILEFLATKTDKELKLEESVETDLDEIDKSYEGRNDSVVMAHYLYEESNDDKTYAVISGEDAKILEFLEIDNDNGEQTSLWKFTDEEE